ncbi:CbiX/SirB N-terminal domain-containing protein [Brachymonas sp. G13]|uniref:sirohydrochlorin chelatase n=1 Tax=Brachymonas wangyanguii TaxID=3130163 RepID=UPI00307DBB6E
MSPAAAQAGVILFAHGSRRPGWDATIHELEQRLRQQDAGLHIQRAYLELQQPDLEQAVRLLVEQHGVTRLHVIPLFLGKGNHLLEDLPALIRELQQQQPDLQLHLQAGIGQRNSFADWLSAEILQDLGQA